MVGHMLLSQPGQEAWQVCPPPLPLHLYLSATERLKFQFPSKNFLFLAFTFSLVRHKFSYLSRGAFYFSSIKARWEEEINYDLVIRGRIIFPDSLWQEVWGCILVIRGWMGAKFSLSILSNFRKSPEVQILLRNRDGHIQSSLPIVSLLDCCCL